jgi:cytochrome c oxidase subunit 3
MSATTPSSTPYYYVPAQSSHPVMAAAGLFFVILGASQWINGIDWGAYALGFGLLWWLVVLFQWFRDAARESEGGLYGRKIDLSYRWSMSWFIFSEVMFFGAFFTALWWARAHSVPALGSLENGMLWPDFKAVWPSVAAGATASPAGIVEPFQTVGPFWLPTINTALLLSSGVTLTIAHHALRENQRGKTIALHVDHGAAGLHLPVCAGLRVLPPLHRPEPQAELGHLRLHVLHAHGLPRLPRVPGHVDAAVHHAAPAKGHFSAERHFGFEGAAWYWHFVDVVWLGLYVLVYWM